MIRTLLALSLSTAVFVPSIVLAAGPCFVGPVYYERDVAEQHCGQGNIVAVKSSHRLGYPGYACKCPKG